MRRARCILEALKVMQGVSPLAPLLLPLTLPFPASQPASQAPGSGKGRDPTLAGHPAATASLADPGALLTSLGAIPGGCLAGGGGRGSPGMSPQLGLRSPLTVVDIQPPDRVSTRPSFKPSPLTFPTEAPGAGAVAVPAPRWVPCWALGEGQFLPVST